MGNTERGMDYSHAHRLNRTEMSQEEFQDNLRFWYGLIPLNLTTACNGCGNKFTIDYYLSCPKGGSCWTDMRNLPKNEERWAPGALPSILYPINPT